jgi:serine/threonine protein kinase
VSTCHSRRIIHRDLKPANILVDINARIVKIADFGLARAFQIPLKPYTGNVQSLLYRAPELFLGAETYGTSIDIWSVGCIFAEMYLHQPIFAASSELDLVRVIFEKMGFPVEENWPGVTTLPRYHDLFSSFANYQGLPLESVLPTMDPQALDLLKRMLVLNPN